MTEEIKFLGIDDVLNIHKRLIEKSPFPDEADNVLDMGLLESAISQPQQTFCGELLNKTIYDQAAAYVFSLSKNHAFENGNKRTALAVTVSFLTINGYKIILPKGEVEKLILDAVLGNISKDDVVEVFKSGVKPIY